MSTRAAEIKAEKLAELKAGQDCEQKDNVSMSETATGSTEATGTLFGSIKATWDKTFGGKAEVGAEGKVTVASSDVESGNKETYIKCTDGNATDYQEQVGRLNKVYRDQQFHEHVSERIDTLSSGEYVEKHDGDVHTYTKTPEGCIKEEVDENWAIDSEPKIHCDKEIPPPGHSQNTLEDLEVLMS